MSIFSKIAAGEIPSYKCAENEKFYAFLDINPLVKGHTLVIPKKHFKDILDFPCELAPAVCATVQKIAGALVAATGAKGVNVLQNNGIAAGQSVFHIHWHIIPRYEGDGLELWHQSPYPSAEAMQEMAAKISRAIQE